VAGVRRHGSGVLDVQKIDQARRSGRATVLPDVQVEEAVLVARCAESRCFEACGIAHRSSCLTAARFRCGCSRRPGVQTKPKGCQGDARGQGNGEGAECVDRGRRCLPEPAATSSG
jgi:hypothetical protein